MRQGQISIYYGMGKGKTAVAVGRGMRAIGEEQRVVMIQFLDYHNSKEIALLKKLEPDFRIFRFEKDRAAEDVQGAENDEALHKEIFNEIRNAFNFAKKIVDTGECEMLLLDGILECVEKDIYRNLICMSYWKAPRFYGYHPDGDDSSGRHCRGSRKYLSACSGKGKRIKKKKNKKENPLRFHLRGFFVLIAELPS